MRDLAMFQHKAEQALEFIKGKFQRFTYSQQQDADYVDTESWLFKLHRVFITKTQLTNYLALLQVKLDQKLEVERALEVVEEAVEKFYPTSRRNLKRMYKNVRKLWQSDIEAPTLTNALRPYLNDIDVMMLESASSNSEGLRMILENAKKSAGNKQTIMTAALAPLGYFLAIFGMVNFMHERVVMNSINIVWNAGKSLQGSLNALYVLNEFILDYQILIIPMILGVFALYAITLPLFVGHWRNIVEKVFIVGLPYKVYRANTSVAFLQTLSTLSSAGLPMENVLKVIIERSNPFLKYEVRNIKDTFDLTGRISESLNTNLFDRDTLFLLAIYLEAKDPSKHIQKIAEEIQTHQNKVMKGIAMFVNVGGLLLVAAYLGLFASATTSVTDYLTK